MAERSRTSKIENCQNKTKNHLLRCNAPMKNLWCLSLKCDLSTCFAHKYWTIFIFIYFPPFSTQILFILFLVLPIYLIVVINYCPRVYKKFVMTYIIGRWTLWKSSNSLSSICFTQYLLRFFASSFIGYDYISHNNGDHGLCPVLRSREGMGEI